MKIKSVRWKIMSVMCVMAVLFLIAMSTQMNNLQKTKIRVDMMKDKYFAITTKSDALKLSVVQVQQWLTDISATRGAAGFNDGFDEAEIHAKNANTLIDELIALDPEETDKLEAIRAAFTPYYETGKKMAQAYISRGPDGGNAMMDDFDEVASNINSLIDDFATKASSNNAALIDDIESTIKIAMIQIVVMAVVLLMVIGFAWFYIAKVIVYPLLATRKAVARMAEGNLNCDITYKSSDEIGYLAESVREMSAAFSSYVNDIARCMSQMENGNLCISVDADFKGDFTQIKTSINNLIHTLNDTMKQINNSADQVSLGSNSVASSSQILAQGATEQAGSVDELSSSISLLASQINDSSKYAEQADKAANKTSHEIENGNKQMQQLMEAMNDISSTSNEIQKIIKTIDDIAFQTNILALNAAVEAARAGSAGKGFAVVADEVRNLAAKSAEAAKNTSVLIQNSISAVDNGYQMATLTSSSLQNIVSEAQHITHSIDFIYSTSQQQAVAAKQVATGIEQISTVVQTTSAIAEESAASSEELSGQSNVLKDLVAKFRTKEGIRY